MMMMRNNSGVRLVIGGFFETVFVVLLILKLTGVVTWSWWIVTASLWVPFLLLILFILGVFVLAGIRGRLSKRGTK
ncbi:hypothetical protein 015DV002_43 [Bacillus phage 015DV002]|nr:hypothetical protein 015DV002_43 [Bacillus phage 015DV002]QQO41273.1 hypothetical protein 015DV004_57 [Bacillus phage 015DV004]